jgi:hypothetical protein
MSGRSITLRLDTERVNREGYHLMQAVPSVSPGAGEYYLPVEACSFFLDTLVVEVCGYS